MDEFILATDEWVPTMNEWVLGVNSVLVATSEFIPARTRLPVTAGECVPARSGSLPATTDSGVGPDQGTTAVTSISTFARASISATTWTALIATS